ncbi:MAG: 2-C-methyl-D-erythritol 2,4-cyclodiphosphate synthase [Solirubrobacterales bacterium]|nr:2-C-methyl-D-erythritol 2,4-cyclodiphosphate synthase [Solirubrobacterales bacterium]
MSRVGIGYDSHRLVAGRPLIIGGVEIDFERGLDGHSDADVLAHAITDAILGAAGAGDIGSHFPPTDERWRDADSIELLRTVVAGLAGTVVNVDATVICERPPIGPHREAIESRLSEAVGAPVAVKATTNEGLGAIGREEGIAAIAVASFDPSHGLGTR